MFRQNYFWSFNFSNFSKVNLKTNFLSQSNVISVFIWSIDCSSQANICWDFQKSFYKSLNSTFKDFFPESNDRTIACVLILWLRNIEIFLYFINNSFFSSYAVFFTLLFTSYMCYYVHAKKVQKRRNMYRGRHLVRESSVGNNYSITFETQFVQKLGVQ